MSSTKRCSVQSVLSNFLQSHGLHHAMFSGSLFLLFITNSQSLFKLMSMSWWCHPIISSSVIPFSSCLPSFPAPGSFPMSQSFISCDQSTGASASARVLPVNIQDWFPLGWTGLISLQSKGLSRAFSNTTVQKYQFFSAQPSLWSSSQHPYMTTGKTIPLIIWNFVSKIMSLLFTKLPRFVRAFLPRRKCIFISWLQSLSAVILEPQKIKSDTVSTLSSSICHEVIELDAMIFVFWMLSFKPTLSLSSFTFIKRLFSSSSLSAIRVVSSAYLRLLIFLPEILIPACASSSSEFHMMYSACKLNKQGDNIQLTYSFPNLEPVHCSMSNSNCCFLTCIQISQEAGQVTWYSHLLKNVRRFVVIHTVKGFGIVNKAEIDVFFWNFLALSMIQWMLAIWSLLPVPFLNPTWTSGGSRFMYCWSLAWGILSITLLECEKSAVVQ